MNNLKISPEIQVILDWKADPCYFIESVWGEHKRPEDKRLMDEWQIDAAMAVVNEDRISIRSGHGVGKTSWLSWMMIWWMLFKDEPRIACTAPTSHQLNDALWGELAKWGKRLPPQLRSEIEIKSERMEATRNRREFYAVARTARKEQPEAFQGFHAGDMLFIADEACFSDDHEILTDNGWKWFSALRGNERVLTMDPDTGSAFYESPSHYYKAPYDGYLFEYDRRGCSFAVTPNHRFYYGYRSPGSDNETPWVMGEVQNISASRFTMKRHVHYQGSTTEYYSLPDAHNRYKNALPTVSILLDDWAEFLGWYLSEGSLGYAHGKPYSVNITQIQENHRATIEALLSRLPFSYRVYGKDYRIHSIRLGEYLAQYGRGALNKRIPRYVMNWPSAVQRVFLDAFLAGDGYTRNNGRRVYYTSSPGLADDLQELVILSGGYASVSQRKLAGMVSTIDGHSATSSVDGYVIYESNAEHDVSIRKEHITRTKYKGNVYCVTAPSHHLIYVRRNGKAFWSGNSGVDDIIFQVGEGAMSTKGAKTILTGNPTRTSGYFFDSHNRMRSTWWTKRVSCEDAKMVSENYADQMAKRYGEDSNIYRVRVLGDFPLTDDDSVIPLESAEAAVSRDVEPITERVVWGVDVARFGDDSSALAKRQGNVQLEKVRQWKGKDLMQTVGIIVNEYNEATVKPDLVLVDSIGLGAGVVDRLKERGIPVRGINVAESSSSSEKYMRLRDELWWKSREWLQERDCRLEDDPDLIGELTSPKYQFTSSGKILIETKQEMKKRGIPSPNVADAWNLTFADSGMGGRRWKSLDYPDHGFI